MKNFWSLTNINVYKILCPPKLKEFGKEEGRPYTKEDIIYMENTSDHNIYLVSNGKVKLVNYDDEGNEIIRQILTKGELFGEGVLFEENKRDEFAISYDNKTTICSMDIAKMRDLMRKNERFSTAIYKFIGFRLRKVQRRLDLLVGKDVNTRVASFIYDQYQDHQSLHYKRIFTHKDIAALLATSRETVNKIFNTLKEEGIIEYNRKEISILNIDALKEKAK